MRLRQLPERLGTEDRSHLALERRREQPVDVVVAVIDQYEAAIAHIGLEVAPFIGIELDELMFEKAKAFILDEQK